MSALNNSTSPGPPFRIIDVPDLREFPKPQDWAPEEIIAFYAWYKCQFDTVEAEKEYQELLTNPAKVGSFEDLLNALRGIPEKTHEKLP